MDPSRNRPGTFPRVSVVVGGWFALALLAGATGLLARAPVPPPAIALVLAAVVLLVLRGSGSVRERVRSRGLAPLVSIHLVRLLAGAYFLVLYRRGDLPGSFAVPAGWGDIAVGAGAVLVLRLCLPVRTTARRAGLQIWNTLGLADILLVLANGARHFLDDPAAMAPFVRLPLALLPTFVVPLVIASHLVLFAWASKPEGAVG